MRGEERGEKYSQSFREDGELRSVSFPRDPDEAIHLLERGVEVIFDRRALDDGGLDGVRGGHGCVLVCETAMRSKVAEELDMVG